MSVSKVKFNKINKGIFVKIREYVKKIQKEKTKNYEKIARLVGTNARVVGWALRGNEDMSFPCHRVIKTNMELADKLSLGNWSKQKRKLEA
ncbi:MAG: MGMT family protein [Candidatus Shapirobacteria bacterium]